MSGVRIYEVSPRDGLQNESEIIGADDGWASSNASSEQASRTSR